MTPEPIPVDEWMDALGEPEPIRVSHPRAAERPTQPDANPLREVLTIPYRTPLEVAASTSESPDWLLRGYLALGAITEVDGKIKSSGKTTLVTHLVAAILDGRPFLGQPTMRTNVVYLTDARRLPRTGGFGRIGTNCH